MPGVKRGPIDAACGCDLFARETVSASSQANIARGAFGIASRLQAGSRSVRLLSEPADGLPHLEILCEEIDD
jgi:hypothetical protein